VSEAVDIEVPIDVLARDSPGQGAFDGRVVLALTKVTVAQVGGGPDTANAR
jgi:hypothetical protein